jgi:hypothetical protein
MSNLEQEQQANISQWYAQELRLTVFLSPAAQIGDQTWWKSLVGEQPQNEIFQPQTGVKRYEGLIKDNEIERGLILTIHPTRIDWQLVSLNSSVSEFPTIGSFISSTNYFLTLMLRWLEDSPPIQRLAFGASLLKRVEDPENSYEQLSKYLPFDLDLDSSDFSYQINRPRKSTIDENLIINRLSVWSIATLLTLEAGFGNFQSNYAYPTVQSTSLSLNLDINTFGEFIDSSDQKKIKQVFKELVELSKEIAEEGDIK